MALAVKIVIVLVVVVVVAIAALRIRKLRRDEIRELSQPVERRLMSPPPSPYAPSKGFRLLDGPLDSTRRPEPLRPRLESDRDYVFSESQMPDDGEVVPTQLRHNEKWALSKSARRSTSYSGLRVTIIALIVIVIAGAIGLYLQRGPSKSGSTTTTTTTTRPSTTTTLALPSSFVATSTSGQTATYRVPLKKYAVIVKGALGPTWAVYKMGPLSTLEWQGTVATGNHESLQMVGDSQITIGAPRSASVTVEGKPVVFPSPLPTTLVLSFVSS
jgi:flagellar basal body-associated protein FliL